MKNIKTLKSSFNNLELLKHALTHKSWVNEHPKVRTSNERLEFLGDAVLEFIISKELYDKFPHREEGYLTALRASLVNTVNLAKVAKTLELGKHLLLSKGEEDTGGRTNQSLLANTIEAIIGALFIDSGIKASDKFIKDNILVNLDEKVSQPLKDPKSTLQEIIQSKSIASPTYNVVKEDGPDHSKIFHVEVLIEGKRKSLGVGKSKNEAEQAAAKKALKKYL
jgi:ribonuclease-3